MPEEKIDWNLKTLHVTNWYPSRPTPGNAPFIKKQIDALSLYNENAVWHIEITKGTHSLRRGKGPDGSKYWIFSSPIFFWWLTEILSAFVLFINFKILRVNKNYDLINFHIAYPNLTYWHLIKRFIKIPVVITEHWSAYHFNFGVNKELPRIKKIFQQHIPVITVSKALQEDIKKFGSTEFPSYVVPNVVDNSIFFRDNSVKRKDQFFMVSQWNWPKRPIVALEAFKEVLKMHPRFKLYIAGYGIQWPEIVSWVKDNKMEEYVRLLGKLDSNEIADYLRTCRAFIHPSEYETFSVVCAEAISCGTPAIVSNVGGIPDVINKDGTLLDGYQIDDWTKAMNEAVENPLTVISESERFSPEIVGKQYYYTLGHILRGTN